MRFKNRREAGQKLAQALIKYKNQQVVVLALPRGGVVLAAEIAKQLKAPLDLVIVRKIGHPYSAEYAIAAVSEDGSLIENKNETEKVDNQWFIDEVKSEQAEGNRRRRVYLAGRQQIDITDKIAIIVDDGIATGLTMKAAIREVKNKKPNKIIIAVPVAPRETVVEIKTLVDEVVVLENPEFFMGAIGSYYQDFPQVADEEVVELLASK